MSAQDVAVLVALAVALIACMTGAVLYTDPVTHDDE